MPVTARVVLALVLIVQVPPARAYVPSRTAEHLTPLRWLASNCILVRVNSRGSDDVPGTAAVVAAKRALNNWRVATASCSYLQWQVLPDTADATAGFVKGGANENVIVWVESGWEHDRAAAALTTVFFIDEKERGGCGGDSPSASDGQILDADIELNGEVFHFTDRGVQDRTDIENTVTHELGHLLGLDHICDDRSDDNKVPTDSQDKPVPSCFPVQSLPAWMREVTMYNFADPGETKKRSPEADDIAGICATYPLADDPGQCVPAEYIKQDSGCTVGNRSAAGLALLLLLLPALLLRRRRRNR